MEINSTNQLSPDHSSPAVKNGCSKQMLQLADKVSKAAAKPITMISVIACLFCTLLTSGAVLIGYTIRRDAQLEDYEGDDIWKVVDETSVPVNISFICTIALGVFGLICTRCLWINYEMRSKAREYSAIPGEVV